MLADVTDASKDPILRGIIERQRTAARGLIYRANSEGERAAYVLPDRGSSGGFAPDPDGVNLSGALAARYVYQARVKAEPTHLTPASASRVNAWNSLVWDAPDAAPADKAVFYGWYFTAKGFQGDAALPQSNSVMVIRGETASGQGHGKTEALVVAAAHERVPVASGEDAHAIVTEDGFHLADETASALLEEAEGEGYVFTNGKLVCNQNVLVFDGPDVGWRYDPDDDDEEDGGDLHDDLSTDGVRNLYPGYGTAWNNAGLTPGFAAGIVKSRKPPPDGTGVPWTHGHYIKKYSVSAFAYRYQRHFGVTAVGFDAGDGLGARAMPYLGLGTDLADTPLHIQGPVTLEQRLEYVGDASAPYALGALNFDGVSSATAQTRRMAGLRVDVTDPAHGSESAEVTLEARQDGRTKDRLHIGQGVWVHGAEGGDQGPGTLNLSALFIDGELELGADPAISDPVTPLSVVATAKGVVVKALAPADKRLRAVRVYRNTVDDPAAADWIEDVQVRSGGKIKFVDTDGLVAGASYFYYLATRTKKEVESPLRTFIGSAVFRGVRAADLEDGAVDLAGAKVTGKDLANIDGTRAGKIDGVAAGATRNRHWKQSADPALSFTVTDYEEWTDTTGAGGAPPIRRVWLSGAWQETARATAMTTHLGDAGGLSRLDPADLFDYPAVNQNGGAYVSPVTGLSTLTYGVDKPALSVRNTGTGDYTITLGGGGSGDRV